jgi:hypothetical protein
MEGDINKPCWRKLTIFDTDFYRCSCGKFGVGNILDSLSTHLVAIHLLMGPTLANHTKGGRTRPLGRFGQGSSTQTRPPTRFGMGGARIGTHTPPPSRFRWEGWPNLADFIRRGAGEA